MVLSLEQVATTIECRTESEAVISAGSHAATARSRDRVASPAERRAILTRTVELDVIPRLLQARGLGRAGASRAAGRAPDRSGRVITPAEVAQLVALTLAPRDPGTSDFVGALQAEGFDADTLHLDLLAPTARRLGELWTEDLCDFAEVTIGMFRLQAAMRALNHALLGSAFLDQAEQRTGPRAVLVPLPGEQHSFGLAMVFNFFRRAGWNAWSGPIAHSADLAAMVRSQWIDVVGFSLACDQRLETVQSEIRAVRRASRNPGLAVMVGGPPFVMDPDLAASVGADGTAIDGLQAVHQAGALLQREAQRR